MKRTVLIFTLGILVSGGSVMAQDKSNIESGISVKRSIERVITKTPDEYFTGRVFLDPLFLSLPVPQRLTGSQVSFEPSARTAWHTHPVGQTLIITSGNGWVQEWGKEKIAVQAGDIVNFLPNVKHWHGATDKSSMSHIAVQEIDENGKNVEWLEKVSDLQYKNP